MNLEEEIAHLNELDEGKKYSVSIEYGGGFEIKDDLTKENLINYINRKSEGIKRFEVSVYNAPKIQKLNWENPQVQLA